MKSKVSKICKGFLLTLLSSFFFQLGNSQEIALDLVDTETTDKGTISLSVNTAYSSSMYDSVVVCGANLVGNAFLLSFDSIASIHESDTLFVYDGKSSDAPLLASMNAGKMDTAAITTTLANPDGCFTVLFKTDTSIDLTGDSTRWHVSFEPTYICQPFSLDLRSSTDTVKHIDGYKVIEGICYGHQVSLELVTDFHTDTGSALGGYTQLPSMVDTVQWDLGNIPVNYSNFDFNADLSLPASKAYIAQVIVKDTLGCSERLRIIFRQSNHPNATPKVKPDPKEFCIGDTVSLFGHFNDTNYHAYIEAYENPVDPSAKDTNSKYLPDVAQNNVLKLDINDHDGLTIYDANEVKLTMNIEHSHIGDLEVVLVSPCGDSITILNGFDPGSTSIPELIKGGIVTFKSGVAQDPATLIGLGKPYEFVSSTNVGDGFVYNFFDQAVRGSIADEFSNATLHTNVAMLPNNKMIKVMKAGDYKPEVNFKSLEGCSINGEWKLIVRDCRIAHDDDGNLFGWSLDFGLGLTTKVKDHSVKLISGQWVFPDPLNPDSLFVGTNDSTVFVVPITSGIAKFEYHIQDEWGCPLWKDHKDEVKRLERTTISSKDTVCWQTASIEVKNSKHGTFAKLAGTGKTLYNKVSAAEWTAKVNEDGWYKIEYTDSICLYKDTTEIYFHPSPWADIVSDSICSQGGPIELDAKDVSGDSLVQYLWSTGSTAEKIIFTPNASVSSLEVDTITVTLIGSRCGNLIDTALITTVKCDFPNIITPNGDGTNNTFKIVGPFSVDGYSFEVYTRWGRLVYKNDDYQNDWEGTDSNGRKLVEGTYFYVVKLKGGSEQTYKGPLTITR